MNNVTFSVYETCTCICFFSFVPPQNKTTPLYVASEKGDIEGVMWLLGAGAEVNKARSGVSDMMFN